MPKRTSQFKKEEPANYPRNFFDCKRVIAISLVASLLFTILTVFVAQMVIKPMTNTRRNADAGFVALALINYSDFRGHLPYAVIRNSTPGRLTESVTPEPDDPPLYSWRVELIPYLVSWHGKWDPTKSWDDPSNEQLIELSALYSLGSIEEKHHKGHFPETALLAITGPGTAFGDGKGQPMATSDVPPQTILVVECRSSNIPWPAPGDFDINNMPQTINRSDGKGISGRNDAGFHVIFADGKVWLLSYKVPYESLQKFFRTADSKNQDRERLLGPFALRRVP